MAMSPTDADAMKPSALGHLAAAHGWRQFWLFGMTRQRAIEVHGFMYPECEVTEWRLP